jgi:hypothetical protein
MRASGIEGQPDGSFFEAQSICRYINNYKTAIVPNQHTETLQIEAEQSILNLQK